MRLIQFDPEQTIHINRRADVERDLGEVLLLRGEFDRARALTDSSKSLFGELLVNDDSNTPWRRGLASSLLVAAAIDFRQGDYVAARTSLDKASSHIGILVDQEPSSRESQQLAIRGDLLIANSYAASDPNAAESAALEAMDRLDTYFPDTSDPWVLELKADALMILDRAEQVDEIRSRLLEMGFRKSSRAAIG